MMLATCADTARQESLARSLVCPLGTTAVARLGSLPPRLSFALAPA